MKVRILSLCFVLCAALTLNAQQPATQDDELEKKLKKLRDQIEELRKQADTLAEEQNRLLKVKHEKERQAALEAQRKEEERKAREEAERRAKEEAEKKKHYVKTEIRGKLLFNYIPIQVAPNRWQVQINELTWNLNLGDKKELLADAGKLVGKSVVITGSVATKKGPGGMAPHAWPYPIYPTYPNPWPNPNPHPWTQQWNPYLPVDATMTITVESIKLAQD